MLSIHHLPEVKMSSNVLKEVLEEVKVVREKLERLEGLVEERLVGSEEPLKDEVKATEEYNEAKKKGKLKLVPIENFEKGT